MITYGIDIYLIQWKIVSGRFHVMKSQEVAQPLQTTARWDPVFLVAHAEIFLPNNISDVRFQQFIMQVCLSVRTQAKTPHESVSAGGMSTTAFS